jgi:hypothetical protein
MLRGQVPAGVRPVVGGLLTTGMLVAGLSGCGSATALGNVITVNTGRPAHPPRMQAVRRIDGFSSPPRPAAQRRAT